MELAAGVRVIGSGGDALSKRLATVRMVLDLPGCASTRAEERSTPLTAPARLHERSECRDTWLFLRALACAEKTHNEPGAPKP